MDVPAELVPLLLTGQRNGDGSSYSQIFAKVAAWHEGRRDGERLAVRRTYVACLVADRYTHPQIAERIGEDVRTIERDVAKLREIFASSRPLVSGRPG